MLVDIGYDRNSAFEYAKKWAYRRNPKYYNFDKLGGDCTNFVSQCILSGCQVMNYKPTFGWYYINLNDRTPSWSGVIYLYNFLVDNKGTGPYGVEVGLDKIQIGDVIQLGHANGFYHSLFVTGVSSNDIFVSTHTQDAFMRGLSTYFFERFRCIHILGARKYVK
jgi:hypothetical protein